MSRTDRERYAAVRTLQKMGYTWEGGEYWKPPLVLSETATPSPGDDPQPAPGNGNFLMVPIKISREVHESLHLTAGPHNRVRYASGNCMCPRCMALD